jgi:hypothetical protein
MQGIIEEIHFETGWYPGKSGHSTVPKVV